MKKIFCFSFLILIYLINFQAYAIDIYPGDIIYMTKNDDTIAGIAHKFNTNPSAIYQLNPTVNKNQLAKGVRLIIPTSKDRYREDVSECQGTFHTGETVMVLVDWKSNNIKVNKLTLKLDGVSGLEHPDGKAENMWMSTETYVNQLDRSVYFMIGIPNPPYHGNFLLLMDGMSRRAINVASLSCAKSFDRPFMKRMLNK